MASIITNVEELKKGGDRREVLVYLRQEGGKKRERQEARRPINKYVNKSVR